MTLNQLLGKELLALLPDSTYLGVCVSQIPGAWTRLGPTWRLPFGDYLTVGPGVAVWNTKLGLAELCVSASAAPQWHAEGAVVSRPNLLIAVTEDALKSHSKTSKQLATLVVEAKALNEEMGTK